MISRILSAIRNALAASVRSLAAFGDDLLTIPWHLKQMLYGADPVGPAFVDVEADGPQVAGPGAQRREMVQRGLLPLDLEPGPDGVDPLGDAVFKYASTPTARDTVDLRKLAPYQMRWLLALDDQDLRRLSEAGRRVCSKLVCGKRVPHLSVGPCRDDIGMACWTDGRPDAAPNVVPLAERVRRIGRPIDRELEMKLAM